MDKKTSCRILVILFLALAAGCVVQFVQKPKKETSEKQIFAMNTVMTFQAYGENASEAVEAAAEEIKRLSSLLSISEETSEVFMINEAGEGMLSEDTVKILERALDIYEQTEGAFDCTIFPLMQLWGFPTKEYHVPTKEEIEEKLKLVDSSKIEVQLPYIFLGVNQKIDFGGIAKGYASDRAIEIFEAYGIESGMVSLGGNIKVLNRKPDGSLWNVGIRNPKGAETDSIAAIKVEDKALVTSGGYERYFEEDGNTYIHIIDPKTGYPAQNGLASVTIVSDDGMLADALSTSLFVMGEEKAMEFWRNSKEIFDMVLITEDERILVTEGLEEKISVKGDYILINKSVNRD